MSEEGADFVGSFGRKDVLELASLLLDFAFTVHGEAVGEQTFGQAMAANDADGAFATAGGEFDDKAAVTYGRSRWFECIMAGIDEGLVLVRFGWMRAGCNQAKRGHFFHGDADQQSAMV